MSHALKHTLRLSDAAAKHLISPITALQLFDSTTQVSNLLPSYRWQPKMPFCSDDGGKSSLVNWRGTPLRRDTSNFIVLQQVRVLPAASSIPKAIMFSGDTADNSDRLLSASCDVSLTKFGRTSLQFDGVIKLPTTDDVLAVSRRTFVRTDLSNKPLMFDSGEREMLTSLLDGTLSDVVGDYIDPPPSNVGTFSEPSATIPLTPQHCNFGSHVDHAKLVDVAMLGIRSPQVPTSVCVVYEQAASVGERVDIYRSIVEDDSELCEVRKLTDGSVVCRVHFSNFEDVAFDLW